MGVIGPTTTQQKSPIQIEWKLLCQVIYPALKSQHNEKSAISTIIRRHLNRRQRPPRYQWCLSNLHIFIWKEWHARFWFCQHFDKKFRPAANRETRYHLRAQNKCMNRVINNSWDQTKYFLLSKWPKEAITMHRKNISPESWNSKFHCCPSLWWYWQS